VIHILFRLSDKFVQQNSNAVYKCRNKNALGSFIPVGVDINGKKNGIRHQRNTAYTGEQ
jgi:hypothetical protein